MASKTYSFMNARAARGLAISGCVFLNFVNFLFSRFHRAFGLKNMAEKAFKKADRPWPCGVRAFIMSDNV